MNGERLDWSAWSDEWQRVDAAPASAPLARRVQSRSRLLGVWVAAEIAIVAAAVIALAWIALTSPVAVDRLAMAGLAVVCAAAGMFAHWNWRDAWRAADASHQAFLDLSLLRCRRVRRAVTAGWCLLAAEVLCFVPWIAARFETTGATAGSYVRGYGWLATLVVAAIVFLIAVRRWADREEAAIRELAATLGVDD